MSASYPSNVKSFATRASGQIINAAHVNDLQDEVAALETALLSSGLAHNLLFVDAAYDIGASGATRPRHLYLSGNVTAGGSASIAGNVSGGLAVGGDFYSHVLVAVGLNGNPLTAIHQVGVYSALAANSGADGAGSFNAGFETAIGTAPGSQTLERLQNYAIGGATKGAGTTITRTWGVALYDETVGTHNAALAIGDATFTGDWFLYYDGSRKSYFAGDLLPPTEMYRINATTFQRLSGGDGPGSGANLLLFGQTHATNANKAVLTGNSGITLAGQVTLSTIGAFAASDKYLVVDSSGNIHVSALGPAS